MNFYNKNILKLSIPSILANITIPIVGMVDIAIAGNLQDKNTSMLIGGITIGGMLFDLLYWSFGFLRAGTGGLTAQAYGSRDVNLASTTLLRSVIISLVASLLLIVLQWFIVQGAFLFVKCSNEVRVLASIYFYIRIWATPATLILMAIKGWFIGMQDTISSMIVDITVVGVNVVASLALAFGTVLSYKGIAFGTVVAQYTGLLLAICILSIKYNKYIVLSFIKQHKCLVYNNLLYIINIFKQKDTKLFFKTNTDLYLRSLCFIGIYMGFTTIAARYGDLALAGSAIIMKLMLFFSYFTDGFAYAGEALTGRFIGENKPQCVRKTIQYTFLWSCSIAILFVLGNGIFAKNLFSLTTSNLELLDFVKKYIIWLILVPIVGCPAFVWDGIYVGATYTKALRNSAVLSVLVFYVLWFVVASAFGVLNNMVYNQLALHILLFAYFAHLFTRTLYQSYLYFAKKGKFSCLNI